MTKLGNVFSSKGYLVLTVLIGPAVRCWAGLLLGRLGSSFLKIENCDIMSSYETVQLDLSQPKKSVASSLILFKSVL